MATQVTIVAHDVEGAGGMERQLRELDHGAARARRDRDGRVANARAAPARAAELASGTRAWPAVRTGLSLVRRRRVADAASPPRQACSTRPARIVVNRADVCTVHYVHNGPGSNVNRASRTTLLHRLNARVGPVISRAFERFVYRSRQRSGVLVAVSEPVRQEIVRAFPAAMPAMSG